MHFFVHACVHTYVVCVCTCQSRMGNQFCQPATGNAMHTKCTTLHIHLYMGQGGLRPNQVVRYTTLSSSFAGSI